MTTFANWNTNDHNASITLSNGNLTAKCGASSDMGVRCTDIQFTGKWYYEITFDTVTGGDTSCGICFPGAIRDTMGNSVLGMFAVYKAGTYWLNGSSQGVLGTITAGSVVCVAMDFDNGTAWVRINGGNWNANASANPATNTLGKNVAAFCHAGAWPCATFNANNDQVTANFGATAFAQAVPSGFTAGWLSAPTTSPWLDPQGIQTVQSNSTSSFTASVTTSRVGSTVVLCIHAEKNGGGPTVSSVSDTAGLTWSRRKQFQYGTSNVSNMEVWTAYSSGVLTADTVTITLSATGDATTCSTFAIQNLLSASRFDTDGSLPKTGTAVNTAPQVTGVTLSHTPDFVFIFYSAFQGAILPASAGTNMSTLTQLNDHTAPVNWSQNHVEAGYRTSTLVNQTFATGSVTSTTWGLIVDAFAVIVNIPRTYVNPVNG